MDPTASAHPKLQAPMAMRADTPGPSMGHLAIVMGDDPDGMAARLRIARGILANIIPPARLAMTLDGLRVEAVQVTSLAPMEG